MLYFPPLPLPITRFERILVENGWLRVAMRFSEMNMIARLNVKISTRAKWKKRQAYLPRVI